MKFWIIKWLGNCSIIGWQVGLGQGESVAAVEQLYVDHESWLRIFTSSHGIFMLGDAPLTIRKLSEKMRRWHIGL